MMTDYYTTIREILEANELATITECGLPYDLKKAILDLFKKDVQMELRYENNSFEEIHWDKIKKECALYDSPLWKALR